MGAARNRQVEWCGGLVPLHRAPRQRNSTLFRHTADARYPVDTQYQPVSFGIITQVCFCKLDPGLRRDDERWVSSPPSGPTKQISVSWVILGGVARSDGVVFYSPPPQASPTRRMLRRGGARYAGMTTWRSILLLYERRSTPRQRGEVVVKCSNIRCGCDCVKLPRQPAAATPSLGKKGTPGGEIPPPPCGFPSHGGVARSDGEGQNRFV